MSLISAAAHAPIHMKNLVTCGRFFQNKFKKKSHSHEVICEVKLLLGIALKGFIPT